MKAYQALYPVTTLCRALGVSSSGYYAWRRRRPSARRQADAQLQAHIEAIHAWSDGTYGTPRIWAGFIYMAVVLDAFSRRVIGWAITAHLGTELVLDALIWPWLSVDRRR